MTETLCGSFAQGYHNIVWYPYLLYNEKSDERKGASECMGDEKPAGKPACRGEKTGKYYIGVLRNLTQGLVPDAMWLTWAREWIVRASEDWLSYSMAALVFWFCDRPEEARRALARALSLNREKTALFFLLAGASQQRPAMERQWLDLYLRQLAATRVPGDFLYVLEAGVRGCLPPDALDLLNRTTEGWKETLARDETVETRQRDAWHKQFLQFRDGVQVPDIDQYQYLDELDGTTAASLLQGALLARPVEQFVERHSGGEPLQEEPGKAGARVLEWFLWDECLGLAEATWEGTYSDFLTFWLMTVEQDSSWQLSPRLQRYLLASSRQWLLQAFEQVRGETARQVPETIPFQFNYSFQRQNHSFTCSIADGLEEERLVAQARADMDGFLTGFRNQVDWHRSALRLLLPFILVGALLFWKGNELLDSFGLGIACLMGFLGLAVGKWIGCLLSLGITVGIGMTLQRLLAAGQRGVWLFVGFLLLLALWQYFRKQGPAAQFQKEEKQTWDSVEGLVRSSCAEVADFRDHYRRYTREGETLRQRLEQMAPDAVLTRARRIYR